MSLRTGLAIAALMGGGCLEPLVSDELAEVDVPTFPRVGEVPSYYADQDAADRIDELDGVERVVPRISGFAGGGSISYWNMGEAPPFVAQLYAFVERAEDGAIGMVDHVPMVDVVPGDAAYSPFWAVSHVMVTERWSGEQITSIGALNRAIEQGLVEEPTPVDEVANCPVVHPDVRLEDGEGNPSVAPVDGYYRGSRIAYFDLGVLESAGLDYPVSHAFVLRREGEEPLSEPQRRVDMTLDGDLTDTNDVLATVPGEVGHSPLRRIVEVVVPGAYASIDTARDEASADYRSASDMFASPVSDLVPIFGRVVALAPRDSLLNLPIAPGSP